MSEPTLKQRRAEVLEAAERCKKDLEKWKSAASAREAQDELVHRFERSQDLFGQQWKNVLAILRAHTCPNCGELCDCAESGNLDHCEHKCEAQ